MSIARAEELAQFWDVSPLSMGSFLDPTYERRWHLRMISDAIVAAKLGTGKPNIIVSMPPRHGKSQLISHWTPLWFLHHWPESKVMLASYHEQFARDWTMQIKASMLKYQEHLNFWSPPGSGAMNRIDTPEGGWMLAQGRGGKWTGRGADLLIVDDPVKDDSDGRNEKTHEAMWRWWVQTIRSRVEPGGIKIVVMTRWHPKDLIGRLLEVAALDGEQWEVITLPAIAETDEVWRGRLVRKKGEPLWPERFDLDYWRITKATVDEYTWWSTYQQKPRIIGGNLIREEWFANGRGRFKLNLKARQQSTVARYMSMDTAIEETDTAAYSAIVVAEFTDDYRLRIVYVKRVKMAFDRLLPYTIRQMERWNWDGKLKANIIEYAASGKQLVQMLKATAPRELRDKVYGWSPRASKDERAQEAGVWMKLDCVQLPEPDRLYPWLLEFEEELFSIPTSAYRDQTDATFQLILFLRNYLKRGWEARGRPSFEAISESELT